MHLSDTRTMGCFDKALRAAGRVRARSAAFAAATTKAAPAQQSKHTASAVDAVVRYLQAPASGEVPLSPCSMSPARSTCLHIPLRHRKDARKACLDDK